MLSHSRLVRIAERWLLNTKKCGFVFSELKACTHNGEIPDSIGFRSGITLLIECKATRMDFLGDKNKRFRRNPSEGMGNFRFYLCPQGIVQPEDLPHKWGLIYVDQKGKPKQVVGPSGNTFSSTSEFYHSEKCVKSEFALMYSALRRLHIRGTLEQIYDSPFKNGIIKEK